MTPCVKERDPAAPERGRRVSISSASYIRLLPC